MGNDNDKNKAADAAALLTKQIDPIAAGLEGDATESVKDENLAKEKVVPGKNAKDKKKVKVKALINLSGRYLMPWGEGQTFECEEKQAKELAEEKAVEFVK